MPKMLPKYINFTQNGQLMVSIDNKNYFFTKRKVSPLGDQTYDLFITDGKKPRIATALEASIVEKYFLNWRTKGFGKQE